MEKGSHIKCFSISVSRVFFSKKKIKGSHRAPIHIVNRYILVQKGHRNLKLEELKDEVIKNKE